jgi:peptidyl-prolyl cis-trans isomerase B (cyclophilin B)
VLTAVVGLLALAVTATGCSQPKQQISEKTASDAAASLEETVTNAEGAAVYVPAYKPTGKEVAVIKTNKGEITVALFGDEAPIHVGSFVELSKKGFYDDTKFHRYEPNFVVQGGDPQTKDMTSEEVAQQAGDQASPLGTGGPGYNIEGEFDPLSNPNKHIAGALGMARTQDPNSAGSQFYFTLQDSSFLDGKYTVFGQVQKGMDVVNELRPGDTIESITISGGQ